MIPQVQIGGFRVKKDQSSVRIEVQILHSDGFYWVWMEADQIMYIVGRLQSEFQDDAESLLPYAEKAKARIDREKSEEQS